MLASQGGRGQGQLHKKRPGFVSCSNTVSGAKSVDLDAILDSNLMAGFEHAPELGDYKILGCMIDPLMQNQAHMIDAGLCTRKEQFEHGRVELLCRMTRYYESKSPDMECVQQK